jgi:hypothetical protein
VRPSEPASGTCSRDVGVPDPRFVGWRHVQASVVLRKAVQIIVMTVIVVTLPVFIELLRDAACTLSRDRHVIVTVTVTEETPYLSGLLVVVTVMTLMTMIYGLILDRGCISTSLVTLPL